MSNGIAEDVIAELNAQWNTSTIAKPEFFNANLSNPHNQMPYGTVANSGEASHDIAGFMHQAEFVTTPFMIVIDVATMADAQATYNEANRILKAKSIAGGWWQCTSHDIMETNDKKVGITMSCYEKKWNSS